MNRQLYYNYIEEKLHLLASRVETNGKLNILGLHMHSEPFYQHFFNLLFGWDLINENSVSQNVEAIDLIDSGNQIIIQVSSTNTKQKIESALSKGSMKLYKGWRFIFISIAKDANGLRSKTYKNPHNVNFDPPNGIYDIHKLLNEILSFEIDKQKAVYDFTKKELGNEVDIVKLDSNLTAIITVLSKVDFDSVPETTVLNSFEIENKINHNSLERTKDVIEDYKIYYTKVDEKYSEFDALGANKSRSVLAKIRKEYIKHKSLSTSDEIFEAVIEAVCEIVKNSANYAPLSIEELELCVDILVVDAFIRCKIFENPEGYNYVAS